MIFDSFPIPCTPVSHICYKPDPSVAWARYIHTQRASSIYYLMSDSGKPYFPVPMSLARLTTTMLESSKPAVSLPLLSPIQLPENLYNHYTVAGQLLIHWRDNPRLPTAVDQWLQANLSQWPKPDPHQVTTTLHDEEVVFTISMEHTPVRLSPSSFSVNMADISVAAVGYTVAGSFGSFPRIN